MLLVWNPEATLKKPGSGTAMKFSRLMERNRREISMAGCVATRPATQLRCVRREGQERNVPIVLGSHEIQDSSVDEIENANPRQLRIRDGFLHGTTD